MLRILMMIQNLLNPETPKKRQQQLCNCKFAVYTNLDLALRNAKALASHEPAYAAMILVIDAAINELLLLVQKVDDPNPY